MSRDEQFLGMTLGVGLIACTVVGVELLALGSPLGLLALAAWYAATL